MDSKTIDLVLAQNTTTIKMFVEMLVKQCTDQVKDLRSEVVDLKRSLEFSQSQVDKLKIEVGQLKNTVLEISEANLPSRTMKLEDDSRKKNIRINGLPEVASETSEQTLVKVQEVIKSKLGLDHKQVISAYRTGKLDPSSSKPRMVLARFSTMDNRTTCLKNSTKLKGTKIFINEDVSPATQAIRNSKWDELRAKREQGYIAYFSGVNIVTKTRRVQQSKPANSASTNTASNSIPSAATGANLENSREKKQNVSVAKTMNTRGRNNVNKN